MQQVSPVAAGSSAQQHPISYSSWLEESGSEAQESSSPSRASARPLSWRRKEGTTVRHACSSFSCTRALPAATKPAVSSLAQCSLMLQTLELGRAWTHGVRSMGDHIRQCHFRKWLSSKWLAQGCHGSDAGNATDQCQVASEWFHGL